MRPRKSRPKRYAPKRAGLPCSVRARATRRDRSLNGIPGENVRRALHSVKVVAQLRKQIACDGLGGPAFGAVRRPDRARLGEKKYRVLACRENLVGEPAASMSTTVSTAGLASAPSLLEEAWGSLTTSATPSRAQSTAVSRPMPNPAPVAATMRPFSIAIVSSEFRDRDTQRNFVCKNEIARTLKVRINIYKNKEM